MDSMRSLNRSLPRTGSTARPSEALLQTFKDAALSVTKLYKEAAASQSRARQAGYQDALDDLLSFLDRQDLGLDDGEGWMVRQWATERLLNGSAGPDESDDDAAASKRGDSPPAAQTAAQPATVAVAPSATTSDVPVAKLEPAPAPVKSTVDDTPAAPTTTAKRPSTAPAVEPTVPLRTDTFTFRASPPASMDVDAPPPPVRTNPAPRRRGHRQGGPRERLSQSQQQQAQQATSLGPGSGSKRKIAIADFFDLSDLKDFDGFGKGAGWGSGGGKDGGKDGGGGTKRSRIN